MARKKVKLAYISNESARKATFKKRKSGLMKKVWELSELCGIDACVIILNPYDSQFEVSPSPDGVRRMLEKFKNMPEIEQTKKMMNQESFLRERIIKAREQLNRKRKENGDIEMTDFMFQLVHTGAGQLLQCSDMAVLNRLQWVIDNNLKGIRNALEPYDNNVNGTTAQVAPISTPTPPQPPASATAPGSILTNPYSQLGQLLVDHKPMNMLNRQWPMDMLNAQGQTGTSTSTGMGMAMATATGTETWLPPVEDMVLPFEQNQPNAFWSNNGY